MPAIRHRILKTQKPLGGLNIQEAQR